MTVSVEPLVEVVAVDAKNGACAGSGQAKAGQTVIQPSVDGAFADAAASGNVGDGQQLTAVS